MSFSPRVCAAVVAPVLAVSALLLSTSPAQATSPSVIIAFDAPETTAQIQGPDHLSPYIGRPVNGVRGVVTAVGKDGYWIQSKTPDGDRATSEGLFVFTSTAVVTVAVGDDLSIDGSITDFRPGGSGGTDNLTTTELVSPKITVLSSGSALPAPVVLGVDRVAPQQVIEGGNPVNVENSSAVFNPDTHAIDFYESLEGMRVAVRNAKVVGATQPFGGMTVVPGQEAATATVTTPRGGVLYSGYDRPNAMRVQLDDTLLPQV
jgi:predicted extracellular nuclease